MKHAEALLHALLRELSCIPGEQMPEKARKELARSLRVVAEQSRYSVSWEDGGRDFIRHYPRTDFVFYQRGDGTEDASAPEAGIESRNRANVAKILADMIGDSALFLPERLPPPLPKERLPVRVGPLPWLLLLVSLNGFLHPPLFLFLLVLLGIILLERLRYEWTFLGFLAAGLLPWIGLPHAALTGAVGMTAFVLVTPRPQGRLAQAAATAATFCSFAVYMSIANGISSALNPIDWIILGGCGVAGLVSWMRGTHIHLAPLLLPFFAFGAVIDGYLLVPVMLVIISIGYGMFR